jgi:hypothetical protein
VSVPNAPRPRPPAPPDSEPAPSLPDLALWGDSDVGIPLTAAKAASPTAASGNPADPLTTIGHIGRYALKYRIGEGGLGTVYAAHDPLLSRLIAIKTLNLDLDAEQRSAFNALFLNEARAAGGLSHPNIVTVFDAGVSDDSAYIAMELLKGRDLRQLRQEGWRPTPTQAALIVRRVADALAYAHSKGVVHRDIKPANIFMVGRTQPRVLDFGIARVAHQHDASGDDIVAGSPYYMSPEQVRQQPVDRRADVFSLGVVLYELLTDQKPFRGSSLTEITTAVLEHEPPAAHLLDRDVPKALAEIAARAMAKDPEHRFRSARALARELRHWLDEHGQTDERPHGAAGRRRRLLWAGGAVAALLLVGVSWRLFDARRGAHPAAPAPLAAALPAPVAGPAAAVGTSAPELTPPATASAPAGTGPAPEAAPTAAIAVEKVAASGVASAAPTAPARTAQATRPQDAARERKARDARPAARAPLASGLVRLAVSPWGQVEIDGTPVGTAPPLNEVTLSEGRHQITIRNEDFAPFSATINVSSGQPLTIKHKFGS